MRSRARKARRNDFRACCVWLPGLPGECMRCLDLYSLVLDCELLWPTWFASAQAWHHCFRAEPGKRHVCLIVNTTLPGRMVCSSCICCIL
mmetsp:Transcript_45199/g.107413  ORF Transcript_45199/g.107413 Transcript_45199/m.107413 type:complete len:90 (-) Transcript_45199:88-357(-)